MSTWRRHRAHRNNRASSMAPPGEEGWTIRHDPAILHSEPYASADLGATSDVDRQVFTVRGCVGLFAEPDLTPTLWVASPHRRRGEAPLADTIGSNARQGRAKRPERPDDSADSAHARQLFDDHVKTDVHRLCALFRSHQHSAACAPARCRSAPSSSSFLHHNHARSGWVLCGGGPCDEPVRQGKIRALTTGCGVFVWVIPALAG